MKEKAAAIKVASSVKDCEIVVLQAVKISREVNEGSMHWSVHVFTRKLAVVATQQCGHGLGVAA